jgi:hypothetical protein
MIGCGLAHNCFLLPETLVSTVHTSTDVFAVHSFPSIPCESDLGKDAIEGNTVYWRHTRRVDVIYT